MAKISSTAVINATRFAEQGGDPASPAAGYQLLYVKSGGVYVKDSAGVVSGPFGAAPSPGGWVADANTWTYSSADGATGVISVNADMTGVLSPGMRIKLTQTTAKYFIVTVVGSFAGGATLVTVYGGTDYTLANAAITSPNYSAAKAPQGFPLDPSKWTETASDTSSRSQASPVSGTWYNLGSVSLSIPIGVWRVSYEVAASFDNLTNGTFNEWVTLSTGNNSESDVDMTTICHHYTNSATVFQSMFREKTLVLAAKTSYYLNSKTSTAGVATIYNRGDVSKTFVRAVCAYL